MTVAAQVTTRVVRSFDDPSLSPAAWAALLAAGPTQGFDLTWEVQRSWWEAFGEGELLLVVASRSGEDVALAPLFSVDGMAFNIASKDRLDLLGDVADPPVLDALLETAASEVSGFVGLRLYLVPDGSPTGGRLQGAAARLGWRVFDEGSLPAPALGITADPEHAERCTRKQSLRRRERWFRDNGELVLRHLSDPEEALTHLPLFFDQHIERRATTSDPSLFLDDRSRRFYELVTRRALVAGSLRFSVLEWDGRPIVFHHGSSYEGRYLYGVPSFAVDLARHWPGEVLLRQLLLAAIAEGVDTFDFGIGDEAYKYRYATQESHLRTWGAVPRMSDRCSIIITSYNYERYLPLAIESALAQTWRAVDVIVVDDGSSDGSPGVIASYGDRVVPVLKENGGQASAFNAGLAVATGDVVIFLDADDLLDPDGVASIMPGFDDERVVKVHWPLRLIDADGARLPGTKPSAVLPEGDLAARVLEGGPTSSLSAPTSGNAWRRSFLDAVGPLPEDVGYYRMCADEYLYTLAPVFGLVARVQRPVGSYRLHGTNVYSARSAEQKLDLEVAGHTEQCGALARTLARHGIQADVDRWRQNSWFHRLRTAVDVILATVPDGESFVLVDEDQWDLDGLVGTRRCTVVGALTVSGGPPADDAESIVLLSALLYYEYIAIGWPAFWWFERYERLTEELHGAYEAVVETGEVVILRRRAAS